MNEELDGYNAAGLPVTLCPQIQLPSPATHRYVHSLAAHYTERTCAKSIAAQAAHTQLFPRASCGTRTSASAGITTEVHQQGDFKSPLAAGAHALAWPHKGHC